MGRFSWFETSMRLSSSPIALRPNTWNSRSRPLVTHGQDRERGRDLLGDWTPEAVGDYFAGPNHVLPTAGTARFASALGVDNFMKKTSVIAYSRSAMERDAEAIMRMAAMEGLEAHAASVRMRIKGARRHSPNRNELFCRFALQIETRVPQTQLR